MATNHRATRGKVHRKFTSEVDVQQEPVLGMYAARAENHVMPLIARAQAFFGKQADGIEDRVMQAKRVVSEDVTRSRWKS